MSKVQLSAVGEIVRRHDPDRFLTALFAPSDKRETLLTLYAFNHELARASEVTREPIAALIRLQWWREVVEGARRRHEIAGPLGEALDSGRLLASDLAALVDAREAELEEIPDLATFTEYVTGTAGGVMVAAARALALVEPERLRVPGAAYGISGVLRTATGSTPVKPVLPTAGPDREQLRQLGLDWLRAIPSIPRTALAAALPIALARHRLSTPTLRPGGRWAVLRAAVTGRP